ncbi:hypothetical protein LIER_37984 [Lithospermum erythrorhizon]|uniref:Protein TIFY n=1 Tax=Lithospermum erythrorhizon TaxID=34254 RepID=A0AAV3PXC4_LITER
MTSSAAADYHHKKVSRTCNLLSQFLKQNGSVRDDLNLVLSPAKPHGSTTKNLLPMIEKCGHQRNYDKIQDLNQLPRTEESAQMTIFYNGQVIVFNQFSQEKAKEIMDLASTTFGGKLNASSSSTMSLTNGLMSSQPLCEGDMPIMRNASLGRFVAKRKDRIRARAPYQLNISEASSSSSSSSSITVDNRKTWLNLSSTND